MHDVPLPSVESGGPATTKPLAPTTQFAAGRSSASLHRVTVGSLGPGDVTAVRSGEHGHHREWSQGKLIRFAAIVRADAPSLGSAKIGVVPKSDCDAHPCCGGPALPLVPLVSLIPAMPSTHHPGLTGTQVSGFPESDSPSAPRFAFEPEPVMDVSRFAISRRGPDPRSFCEAFPANPLCETPPPPPADPPLECPQLAIGDPPRLPTDQPQIRLWPCGVIPYQFAATVSSSTRGYGAFLRNFVSAVSLWNDALEGWVALTPQRQGDPVHHLLVNIAVAAPQNPREFDREIEACGRTAPGGHDGAWANAQKFRGTRGSEG